MASKLATLGGAALALLMVASLPVAGLARGGGGGGGHGGGGGGGHMGGGGGGHMGGGGGGHIGGGGGPHMGGFGGGHFGGPRVGAPLHFAPRGEHFAKRPFHARRFDHRRAFFVAPAYGYSDYGYGYGCYWLRRNALATGSPYWWNRYSACLYGY